MRKQSTRKTNLQGRIETLEPRVVMSADPLADLLGGAIEHHGFDDGLPSLVQHVETSPADSSAPADALPPLSQHVEGATPDFWITDEDRDLLEAEFDNIEQMLASAHNLTGWNSVNANYGFNGAGQTVAVIDSGIAYDHYALGGGLGANYRVVGGWDFTENDADPYDDGPSGSHGTHVSGIIGSSDTANHGVASGVDLVGLRVFNDTGAGYFSWVESALQWVHQNRNAFENPITTVNLSIGVSSWNAESIPAWANLEEEFAQLEADGIFIAVSAGNAFTSFNTTGLSYPAASSHVVPVMSVDDSGLLSYYSQRSTRAIAGPGRGITSTVPDYAGNDADNITNDFKGMSGTSMASPYVAGSSVLIREAMELVGMTGITQDTIYDHMMATADSFIDSATGLTFKRLNLQNAIDALMPTDDYGSSMVDAYNMGSLSGSMSMNGMISNLSDVDYFKFTAQGTGTVTFNATSTTHEMAASWTAYNSQGASMQAVGGSSTTFSVVAGQTYTVGLSSSNGLGYYAFDVTADTSVPFTPEDWGVVTFDQHANQSVSSESWYRVTASQAGYFTALANFSAGGDAVSVSIYDTQQNLIANGTTAGTTSRVDVNAAAGQVFLLRLQGANADVDVTLANLVAQVGTSVTANGTGGDDAFSVSVGSTFYLTVNDIGYGFSKASVSQIVVSAAGGSDSLLFVGSTGSETAEVRSNGATIRGSGYRLIASGLASQELYSGGGSDTVYLYDTAGDDQFTAQPDSVRLSGDGFDNVASGFARVVAAALAGGDDTAYLFDSAGNDLFVARPEYGRLSGVGFSNEARGFDRVFSYSTAGGNDRTYLYDSANDDEFVATPASAYIAGNGFHNEAVGFNTLYVYATEGGFDHATFNDSQGDDWFLATPEYARMHGAGFYNYAWGFDQTLASATGGKDVADLYDSDGNDVFEGRPEYGQLSGSGYSHRAAGFDQVYAYASRDGFDRAYFYDSAGDDLFVSRPEFARMTGDAFKNYAGNFDEAFAYSEAGGDDRAYLYDSAGNDYLVFRPTDAVLSGNGFRNEVVGFRRVSAYATSGGTDHVDYYHEQSGESFLSGSTFYLSSGIDFYNYASRFSSASRYASDGSLIENLTAVDQAFASL
ncbi:MAG: S8 family serine peptidase [Planctomycetales bacterium]|nr:S8 family serine peptidase [Planctomycetales bacterium]